MYKDLDVHLFYNCFQDTKFNYNIAQFEKKTQNINLNKKSKFQLMFWRYNIWILSTPIALENFVIPTCSKVFGNMVSW
jgi:hypothetical protein